VSTPSPRLRGEGRGEGQARRSETLRGKDQKRNERARLLRRPPYAGRAHVVDPPSRPSAQRLQIRPPGADRSLLRRFVCRERRLIVELDGGQHADRPEDRHRDRALCALGYRVIRIWNNDVIENLDGVLQTLLSELEKRPLTPALSPQAGRGR
jgi:hypothetical protein